MGKEDIAYKWLEESIESKEGPVLFTAVISYMKEFQSQPRFIELMKRINHPVYLDK